MHVCHGAGNALFILLAQEPIAAAPSKAALDDPSLGNNAKRVLDSLADDHFDFSALPLLFNVRDKLLLVALVHQDGSNARQLFENAIQQRNASDILRLVRGVNVNAVHIALRINGYLSFSSLHFLVSIKAARFPFARRFGALAVYDQETGLFVASFFFRLALLSARKIRSHFPLFFMRRK